MTKFKVLEVIIKNCNADFNVMRKALMQAFPEFSWEMICSFVALLGKEGYIKNLYGDNELQAILIEPDAFARLYTEREISQNEQIKNIIDRILKLFPLAKVWL